MADMKHHISKDSVATLAAALAVAAPDLDTSPLLDGIEARLGPLRLMERVDLVVDRLESVLPETFTDSAALMFAALDAPELAGWITLPCSAWVARAGLDDPDTALPLLAALTPRFSSEFAVRPFIETHPQQTFEYLERWVEDPDAHVRRLVSEGTRPRLPWAGRLQRFIEDPSPTIPLLDRLVGDPSAYVRRSVANHLNDIAKDHPALALDCARRWRTLGDGQAWVVRHGLRTLIKAGDSGALRLLGLDPTVAVDLLDVVVDRSVVPIGGAVTFAVTLALGGVEPAEVVIDYRVTYQGARGPRAPKVFKLTRRTLHPGRPETITRRHVFEHVSIRRISPGPHPIEVQVNGRVLGGVVVEVLGDVP